jgi:hypothetical protein
MMLQAHWQSSLDRSRFHGTLTAGHERWEVYFVEVRRTDRDWVVDCIAIGPRAVHATIRCRSEINHYQTAHRVMSVLRNWLATGDCQDAAYLEVPESFERAS